MRAGCGWVHRQTLPAHAVRRTLTPTFFLDLSFLKTMISRVFLLLVFFYSNSNLNIFKHTLLNCSVFSVFYRACTLHQVNVRLRNEFFLQTKSIPMYIYDVTQVRASRHSSNASNTFQILFNAFTFFIITFLQGNFTFSSFEIAKQS